MSTTSLISLNEGESCGSRLTDTSESSVCSPRKYGWKIDKTDTRDLKMINKTFFKSPHIINFPAELELCDLPPVYEQGELGSCTANAISSSYRYGKQQKKKKSLNNSHQVGCLSTIMNDC
jgi:hypothetical protein